LRGGHLRVHLVFSPGSAGFALGLTPTSKGARPALAVLVDPAHHRIALARGTATGWALIGRWLALPRVPTMTADLAVDGPIVTLKLGGRQIARAVRPALPGAVRLVVASLKGKATGVPAKLSRLDVLAL
jgi:hypothetical protein